MTDLDFVILFFSRVLADIVLFISPPLVNKLARSRSKEKSPFTTTLSQLWSISHDVPELHNIDQSPDVEALK